MKSISLNFFDVNSTPNSIKKLKLFGKYTTTLVDHKIHFESTILFGEVILIGECTECGLLIWIWI
jgi:hypothetical protein